jgi:hypothetical protein
MNLTQQIGMRVDRVGFSENFTVSEFVIGPRPLYSGRRLTAAQAFNVQIFCEDGVTATQCNNALNGIRRAGERIAQVLRITRTINVYAEVSLMEPGSLGAAMVNSFGFVQRNERVYTMPQALMKQLRLDANMAWNPFDIVAYFNSGINWYYDRSVPIRSTQTDFEYVAVHELTHGLGFAGSFLPVNTVYQNRNVTYLAPPLLRRTSNGVSSLFFMPPYLYIGSIPPLDAAAKVIETFPMLSVNQATFLTQFEASAVHMNASLDAFRASTTALSFVNGTTSIPLYAPSIFQRGSSISHLPLNQSATPDAIMIPSLRAGVNMDNLISGGVYGPQTKIIMEAMGWPTIDRPAGTVQVATNYTGPSPGRLPSSGIKAKPFWILTLFAVLFLA